MIDINFLIPVAQASEAAAEASKPGIAGTFGINWMLFLAQLINFCIVVYVLKKFAFGPISKKLEERTEKIDIAIKDAKRIEEEKLQFEQWKAGEEKKFREQATKIIDEAKLLAVNEKQKIISEAKLQAENAIISANQQIKSEESKVIEDIKKLASEMVVETAQKFLKEKISTDQDKKLISDLLGQIKK